MNPVGICGWGAYIPRYRIRTEEIARVWGRPGSEIAEVLGVESKAVAGSDEDTVTMAVEAARNAIARAGIDASQIGAVFVGSESHPYVVKPSGTIVAEAIGASQDLFTVDYQFACKAGTAAMQTCFAMARAGMIKYGVAVGGDTAQGKPGDALEYTAGSGAAAFVIGENPAAIIEDTYSFATDSADFWRRPGEHYPSHGARFTGEPGYFKHLMGAIEGLLKKTGQRASDFDFAVVHMPNAKFPLKVFKELGVPKEKFLPGLVVTDVGNTYAGSSLLGLAAILDVAKPGQKILCASYGSGAGGDSFSIAVTDKILDLAQRAPTTEFYRARKQYIDYGAYARMRGKLVVE